MKTITVAQDEDYQEALYMNGTLVTSEETIFACEIAHYANGKPFILKFVQCELEGEFPRNLTDLKTGE